MKLTTGEIKMGRGRLLSVMLLYDTGLWTAVYVAFGVTAVAVALMFGWVYAVITFAFWLLIGTFLLVFLYIVFGFKPLTACNPAPHTLELHPDRLTLRFHDGDEDASDAGRKRPTRDLPLTSIGNYTLMSGGVVIPSTDRKEGWLWLPVAAFERPEEMREFLQALYNDRQ